MKIAVVTDVHSNFHSLEAVMEDIASEKPDLVVGGGDMVGCSIYPGAVEVWNALHDREIAFVMGNEEQRIVSFYDPSADPYLKNSVQFMPLQYRARQFSKSEIAAMRTLPFSILLPGPQNRDIFVCHVSPNSFRRSPIQGIDDQMEQELAACKAKVIVVGHFHRAWHRYWNDKLIIMAGSAGLPLRGELGEVDYLVLTYQKNEWLFKYKTVKYNNEAAVKEVLESNALEQMGPMGWLMLDEILTQEDHLIPFLQKYCPGEKPVELERWKTLVIGYLNHIQRWEAVKPYVQRFL